MRYDRLVRLAGALIAAVVVGAGPPTFAAAAPSGTPRFEQSSVSHMPGAPAPEPGRHPQKLTLTPSYEMTGWKIVWRGGWSFIGQSCYLSPPVSHPGAEVVGYANDIESCDLDDIVYQTGLDFNLGPLEQHQQVIVTSARLRYGERVVDQRLGNGRPPGGAGFPSCSGAIGIPDSKDWMSGHYRGLISNHDAPVGDDSGPGDWDVTALVEGWHVHGTAENPGLVIRGDNESFPENNAACVSLMDNFRIDIEFVGK